VRRGGPCAASAGLGRAGLMGHEWRTTPWSTEVWQDPGLWIALGVSALFIVVGVAMHRVFVKILKQPPAGADKADPHE